MALEANQRHVAVGVEATHDSANIVTTDDGIDIHVGDASELNSVLTEIRSMVDAHVQPSVWPHASGESVAVRLG